ncbi:unnamed protein product [Adineta steineri]|uniref:Chromo domain-containing protein n=1 Tax=Adineta steineri TaxID=433720 RepID=A0A815VVG2_9BILA|nr:unnamed protein product [Adineta steineri]CAF1533796.1 unnamed protein product [Adineta steineri]
MVNVSLRKRQRETNSNHGDESEHEHEYVVEAILDKRVRGKKIEYFLKWQGYTEAYNTWEQKRNLNCPDLMKDFEEKLKSKTNEQKSTTSKRKSKLSTKKSKNTNANESDKNYESDEYQDITSENGTTSNKNDEDEDDEDDDDDDEDTRSSKRHSPRKKLSLSPEESPSSRRHSSRKIVNQTNSRITTMSKNGSSNDDEDDDTTTTTEDESLTKKARKDLSITPKPKRTSNEQLSMTIEDKNNNTNNNSSIFSDRTPPKEINICEPTTINLRLHITPSSTSSISSILNDSDIHNHEKSTTDNSINDQGTIDETNQVEKIEAVRNNHDGISFRIKLINEKQSKWISSKIANKKYSQAVIAFWENHVEFT